MQQAQTPIGNVRTAGSSDLMAAVRDGLRYTVTNDLQTRLAPYLDQPYYDATHVSPTLEESIRRSANESLAAAILLTTTRKAHPPGISRDELRDFARWQIRSLACQHGAITPGGWGNTWQSALWAVTIGQAAWMLWPSLTKYERGLVSIMVITEAEAASARGPRYFRNRLGQELTPGDSQSDEVSWDLMAPALALAMMPDHPNAPRWRRSLIAMSLAAFARPQDLHRAESYNGVRLDIRLPGTNANEDGTVTNHGIVNPDYTQNVQHLWWAASLLRAGGVAVPEALFVNADIVYRALATVDFPAPPVRRAGRHGVPAGRADLLPDGRGLGRAPARHLRGRRRLRAPVRRQGHQRRAVPARPCRRRSSPAAAVHRRAHVRRGPDGGLVQAGQGGVRPPADGAGLVGRSGRPQDEHDVSTAPPTRESASASGRRSASCGGPREPARRRPRTASYCGRRPDASRPRPGSAPAASLGDRTSSPAGQGRSSAGSTGVMPCSRVGA